MNQITLLMKFLMLQDLFILLKFKDLTAISYFLFKLRTKLKRICCFFFFDTDSWCPDGVNDTLRLLWKP